MSATSKDDQRRERMREFQTLFERARAAVSALALIVQGREARVGAEDEPLEVAFARAGENGPALPAALWVALRRGDVEMALQLLARASDLDFVVGEREEMGSGYRLETVEEKRALPDVELLQDRLALVVGIPGDVLAVLAEWGAEDPRTLVEVDSLLDVRFGALQRGATADPGAAAALSMSVPEMAAVLQLTPAQASVLATLAQRTTVAITPEHANTASY